jgi:leucyl/phenylalanyl-tRNA--protein transferase
MRLPWLEPGDPFPPAARAWGPRQPAPGLLAAGGALDVDTLQRAYRGGIFPWFSAGQPILWWSTDPRMVLYCAEFRLHRSLRKTLQRFADDPRCEIRFDHDFGAVIRACAGTPRDGQDGTWIVPAMVQAYESLHAAGLAHSVETWIDGELAGGLYCVAIGQAVYGESMFTRVPDASKIALAALVAFCRAHGIACIDCQQNTRHLASLGAREIPREQFVAELGPRTAAAGPAWKFDPVYWRALPLSQPRPAA